MRRDSQQGYDEYLKRLAQAEGVEANDAAALRRMDRKRPKRMRNEEWVNPADAEAEITRLKDGRTALAYKAEQAVDMETGAIVAVTTHGGAVGDTDSIGETVAEAGMAVAEQTVQRAVNQVGIEEVVADKGYHSNEVMRTLAEWKLRSYVAEPERGARKWKGKAAEQAAVYANRRRISGARGKRLQAGRGERVERNFAHQFDTGGMDRLYVRGLDNVHKKFLIQAAACNLALRMRSLYGAGKPRAAHDLRVQLTFAILRLYSTLIGLYQSSGRCWSFPPRHHIHRGATIGKFFTRQNRRFRDGLLGVGFKRTAHNSHGVGEYISPVRYCEQRGSDETALNPMAYAALTAFLDSLPAFGGPVTRHSSWRPTACAFSRRRLCSGRRRIGDVSLAAGA